MNLRLYSRGMRKLNATGVLTAIGGLALLAWVISRVGAAEIAADLAQVGWGLLAVVAIGGLRFVLRAAAWQLCIDPPHKLRLADAFAAAVCGDALGNLTPLGPIVGEPAKAAFVRRRVPLGAAAAALTIENVLYTLSAAAMIAAGMVALVFFFRVPSALQSISEAAVAATLALFAVALWLLWRQPPLLSRALGATPRLERHASRARALEMQVYSFALRSGSRLPLVATVEVGFHALGVAEVYLTLRLLGNAHPGLLTCFILETANRLIQVVFKIVPLRLGVDEAATAWFTRILGLGPTVGVALAIVRKVRMLFWTGIGALLLIREGLSTGARSVQPRTDDRAGS
jgi:hypothetical protein